MPDFSNEHLMCALAMRGLLCLIEDMEHYQQKPAPAPRALLTEAAALMHQADDTTNTIAQAQRTKKAKAKVVQAYRLCSQAFRPYQELNFVLRSGQD